MKFHADSNSVKNPSCRFWHPSMCLNYKSEKRLCTWQQMPFPTCWGRKPNKKSKKGDAKGSVAILKESIQFGCVSQNFSPRKSILREPGKLGTKHAVKFSKSTAHQIIIRERKGPSRGVIQKCAPHERSPCAPKFGERSHEETWIRERWARKAAWDLAKNIHKLKNSDNDTF